MAYKLWELLRDVYTELGQLQVSTATGGSTTTIVDTKLVGNGRNDDWNDGTVILITDAGGAGAAPEGEFKRVSDYVDSTGTLTMESAMTVAPASGDVYGLISAYYPMRNMIENINLALRSLGDMPLVDTTTLDTADNQTEYTAAVAWKRRPPYRIDIQTETGDADDNLWKELDGWEYIPAAAGSTGLIVFNSQPPSGYGLRIWYRDLHGRVDDYSDVINESIHPALITAASVEKALMWQNSRLGGTDDFLLQRWNDAKAHLERVKMTYPIWKPKLRAKSSLANLIGQ